MEPRNPSPASAARNWGTRASPHGDHVSRRVNLGDPSKQACSSQYEATRKDDVPIPSNFSASMFLPNCAGSAVFSAINRDGIFKGTSAMSLKHDMLKETTLGSRSCSRKLHADRISSVTAKWVNTQSTPAARGLAIPDCPGRETPCPTSPLGTRLSCS